MGMENALIINLIGAMPVDMIVDHVEESIKKYRESKNIKDLVPAAVCLFAKVSAFRGKDGKERSSEEVMKEFADFQEKLKMGR
jgi:hypothetical protein